MKRVLLFIALVSSWAFAQTVATTLGGATGYQNVGNDGSTGTLLNGTVCFTTASPSAAIQCATTTTNGVAGICAANCGTGATNPIITGTPGQIVGCVFDGATTAGDFVVPSSTTAGNCHDSGSSTTVPSNPLGRVLSTNGAGGTFNMVWRGTVDLAAATTPNFTTGWTVAGATSGGIPYFDSTTDSKSSAVMGSGQVVTGGGAGNAPVGLSITAGGILANAGSGATTSGVLTGGAIMIGGGAAGTPSTTNVQLSNTLFQPSTTGTFGYVGVPVASNSAPGGWLFHQADITGAGGALAIAGTTVLRGGNNASTNTTAQAGFIGLYGGTSTGATSTAHQGSLITGQAFLKGTTVTQWNLQCATAVAETTADCAATPAAILGVAVNVGSIAVTVASGGEVPINASAAVILGHTVCAGSTAGQVTDSGGTSTCGTGFLLGIVTRTAGAYVIPDSVSNAGSGTSVTLSTTLPMVRINGLK